MRCLVLALCADFDKYLVEVCYEIFCIYIFLKSFSNCIEQQTCERQALIELGSLCSVAYFLAVCAVKYSFELVI